MQRIITFANNEEGLDAYTQTTMAANAYLAQNPGVKVVSVHPAMQANEGWSEYALTLLVEGDEVPLTEDVVFALNQQE